jgi:hypothetical protein
MTTKTVIISKNIEALTLYNTGSMEDYVLSIVEEHEDSNSIKFDNDAYIVVKPDIDTFEFTVYVIVGLSTDGLNIIKGCRENQVFKLEDLRKKK